MTKEIDDLFPEVSRKKKLTKDEKLEIIRLCRNGARQSAVAKHYGVSQSTVSRTVCCGV